MGTPSCFSAINNTYYEYKKDNCLGFLFAYRCFKTLPKEVSFRVKDLQEEKKKIKKKFNDRVIFSKSVPTHLNYNLNKSFRNLQTILLSRCVDR